MIHPRMNLSRHTLFSQASLYLPTWAWRLRRLATGAALVGSAALLAPQLSSLIDLPRQAPPEVFGPEAPTVQPQAQAPTRAQAPTQAQAPEAKVDPIEFQFRAAEIFAPGSAELTESGKTRLRELARDLLQAGHDQDGEVQIQAHTDDLPVVRLRRLYATNWELSGARTFAAVRIFEEAGFPAARLSGTGFGAGRPERPNTSQRNREKNRRLIIRLIKRSAAA